MAESDVTEGQALWQPGGAEEDSRLCEGNRHLHLAYDEEEEEGKENKSPNSSVIFPDSPLSTHHHPPFLLAYLIMVHTWLNFMPLYI